MGMETAACVPLAQQFQVRFHSTRPVGTHKHALSGGAAWPGLSQGKGESNVFFFQAGIPATAGTIDQLRRISHMNWTADGPRLIGANAGARSKPACRAGIGSHFRECGSK